MRWMVCDIQTRSLERTCLFSSVELLDTEDRPFKSYKVVALGAGHSDCNEWLRYNGTMVHDCHAIVIARRALLRYKLLI